MKRTLGIWHSLKKGRSDDVGEPEQKEKVDSFLIAWFPLDAKLPTRSLKAKFST